jgi:hypothetical protein
MPEVPVSSAVDIHRRYLDYLGFESGSNAPLLVVEEKTWGQVCDDVISSRGSKGPRPAVADGSRHRPPLI